MKETATVLKLKEENRVLLRFHEQEGCKSCTSMFCKANERTFTAENKTGMPLDPGDTVLVFLPSGKTVKTSFLILIAPLILFFIFFLFSERVLHISIEIGNIGFGLGGVGIGFLISYFVFRSQKSGNMAQIIEKIIP